MIRDNIGNGRRQTLLSMVILGALALIAAGLVITQIRYSPAILHKDELFSTANTADQSALPTSFEAFVPLPPGFKPLSVPEMFDTATLSDKINGKAELYLSAGFSGLVSQRFGDEVASDRWIEAFVYDMGSSQNAFAVFSAQRRENAETLDVAQYSYRSPNAVFLVHGRYYVELIGSQASSQMIQSMEMLAAAFIRNTQTETVTLAEQDLFPKQDLIDDSLALIATDAFGYDQLNQIYTAGYRLNDEPLMAYLSRRRTPHEAQELAASYGKFLMNFGGRMLELQLPIKNAQMIEILDTYEIVFSYGPYLAGVREAPTRDRAEKLAIKLYNQIKEVARES